MSGVADADLVTGTEALAEGTWTAPDGTPCRPDEIAHAVLFAVAKGAAPANYEPTPYAKAFRERVCPVPEFPSVEKGTHE